MVSFAVFPFHREPTNTFAFAFLRNLASRVPATSAYLSMIWSMLDIFLLLSFHLHCVLAEQPFPCLADTGT